MYYKDDIKKWAKAAGEAQKAIDSIIDDVENAADSCIFEDKRIELNQILACLGEVWHNAEDAISRINIFSESVDNWHRRRNG